MTNMDFKDFVHTGPDTLAGRYMRTFWQPVYVGEKLPAGWAKPIRIMSEDFTLYRGEGGKSYLVGFRCAHRGTQLSTGWVEEDCIRCLYHGWKYDGSGQCVEQPGEQESFASKVRIRSCPTKEYLGLIFAYLGEGEPPPFPRLPDFEREGILSARSRTRACNYFSDVENSTDVLHVAWAHRQAHVQHSLEYETVSAYESDWGVTAYAKLRNGKIRTNQFGMPTMLHFRPTSQSRAPSAEGTDVILWRVPIDDEKHSNFSISLVHATGEAAERFKERRRAQMNKPHTPAHELAQAILRGEMRTQDLGNRSDVINFEIVNVQDDVSQIGQGTIPNREAERLGCSDTGVILLRQIWMRELQAFAEGRPLKKWTRPEGLTPTTGM